MTKEEKEYAVEVSNYTPEEVVEMLRRFGGDGYYEPWVSLLHKEILKRLKKLSRLEKRLTKLEESR